jgi:iron complex outermembrane receptor protein
MISKPRVGKVFSCLFLIISSFFAHSQSVQLKEAQVHSLRMSGGERLAGQPVELISFEEIQQMNVRSIDELLRYLPLMDVQSRGMFGSQSDLSLRGSSFNQVLVLIDGMRSGDPLTGHFASYLPVSIAEIERIEVLRGPAAAIYGADAVGGVIHIITKTNPLVSIRNNSEEVLKGTFGSFGFRGMEGGIYGRISTREDAIWQQNGGMQWNQAIGPPNSDTSHSGFNHITGSYALGYQSPGGKYRMQTRYGWDARAFDARNFYTLSRSDQGIEEVERWMLQHKSVLNPTGPNPLELSLNLVRGSDSFLFSPASRANVHQTSYASVQLIQRMRISEMHEFLYGLMFDDRRIESNDRGNRVNQRWSGYFTGQFVKNHLRLNYGLRTEWDDHYKFEPLPQFSALYHKKRMVYRMMASRGIRGADFTERYYNTSLPTNLLPGRNLGNPALRAERFWNFEGGLRWAKGNLQTEVNVFYRLGNDLIDYRMVNGAAILQQFIPQTTLDEQASYLWADNIRRLDVYGLEFSGNYHKKWRNLRTLDVRWGYGYNGLQYERSGFSKYISGTTRHLLNGSIRYTQRGISVLSQGLLKDRYAIDLPVAGFQYDKTYFQWNLKFSVNPSSDMSIFMELNNVLDRVVSDIYGAVLPGRWVMAGIHYGLDNYR